MDSEAQIRSLERLLRQHNQMVKELKDQASQQALRIAAMEKVLRELPLQEQSDGIVVGSYPLRRFARFTLGKIELLDDDGKVAATLK